MTTLQAVLFDFDGVLLETSDLLYEGYRRVLSTFGIEYTEAEFNKNYGLKTREHFRKVLREKGIASEESVLEEAVQERDRIYRALCEEQPLELLPGARALLVEIDRNRTIMGIASSTHRNNLDYLLPKLGINGYFAATVAGNEATRGKPDPEMYRTLCGKLDVDPQHCVGIEDTDKGIQALKAAGIPAIAVMLTNRIPYNFPEGTQVVRTLEEVTYNDLCHLRQ